MHRLDQVIAPLRGHRTIGHLPAVGCARQIAVEKRRPQIVMTFDKRTLASHLGMRPEILSRNLAMLSKHGVKSSGRDIMIEDLPALQEFAKPTALIDE